MERDELIKHAARLREKATTHDHGMAIYLEIREFLRIYGVPNNTFFEGLNNLDLNKYDDEEIRDEAIAAISAFHSFVDSGLHQGISPERAAQLEVVSDYLGMADNLLQDGKVHPVAPAVIIGATLEEYLRTWVEAEALSVSGTNPGIDAYAKALRTQNLIIKQNKKDIDSWAGHRNNAAHGKWDEVKDRALIKLMLQGVNLFIATHGQD